MSIARALVYGVFEPGVPLSRRVNVLAGFTASGVRLAAGTFVTRLGARPEKPLVLYEFEACPFCRRVREALSMLDLDVEVRPCPKGGTRFRPEVQQKGGKLMFPYLEDPNSGGAMYESGDIVRYLFERYGNGKPPAYLDSNAFTAVSGGVVTALNAGRGASAAPSRAPEQPLVLYAFESSPFSRFVRETLCELELPYLLKNVAKGSPRRPAFEKLAGKVQVPFLVDPNTGTQMFESAAIQQYLRTTYGA